MLKCVIAVLLPAEKCFVHIITSLLFTINVPVAIAAAGVFYLAFA